MENIKQARKVRHACQVHEQNIAKVQDQQQKRTNQKKDSFRRSIERKLHSVVENLENLKKEFPELPEAQRSTILTVMSDTSSLNRVCNRFLG